MYTYQKLYHDLFNAITDALELLDQREYFQVRRVLTEAQQTAEEHYMEEYDPNDDTPIIDIPMP